jgi:hypothetical protein
MMFLKFFWLLACVPALLLVGNDSARFNCDDSFPHPINYFFVMSGQDYDRSLAINFFQNISDFQAGFRIKIPGRLIGN